MGSENYYSILGIRQDATDEQVKQAFRERAKNCHPDRHPNNKEAELEFKRINTAYEGLKDVARREAYNEWLTFAQRRERSKLMQWSRLAALTVVLLLGPSAVLYWAIAVADLPGLYFRDRPLSPEEAERAARMAAIKEAAETEIGQVPEQEENDPATAEAKDDNSASDVAPDRAETIPEPAPLPEPAPSQSAGASSQTPNDRPARQESEAAGRPRQDVASDESAPAIAPPARPRRDQLARSTIESPTQTDANQTPLATTTDEVTQSIADEAQGNAASLGREQPTSSAQEERSNNSPSPSLPIQRDRPANLAEPSGNPAPSATDEADSGESRAKAMARLIAELKEPEANPAAETGSGDGFDENASLTDQQNEATQQFTDCRDCPVMALVSQIEATPDRPPLAISRKQVTWQEWNACVEEGVCPSYGPFAGAESSRPILNVAKRDAELYVDWLSRKTGQNYHLLTPVKVGRENAPDAGSTHQQEDCAPGRRRNRNSSWEWLDDAPRQEPDCVSRSDEPQESGNQRANELRGFRVARRVLAER